MPTVSRRKARADRPGLLGGPAGLFLIAGPCVLESRRQALFLARSLKALAGRTGTPFIFKASFDKANRSSRDSFRGPGLDKGLEILRAVKDEVGVPVLSDVHETWQVAKAASVLDVLQIPAFLCRQTDLISAAADTGKPVNIKKGQFMSPQEMRNAVDKVLGRGNAGILLTERGTTFGYNNLVVDVRSIPIMKGFGCPVVIDASHSVQKPGGEGLASGGDRVFIPVIARAAVAAGADGVFLEVHENPAAAKSDKHNAFPLDRLEDLWSGLLALKRALREGA
ncbi:MAG: 3-deoxy-8-phosphooctulonate synthase [Candidatus Aminicenantales bacterium]|jgi:2-dehydro-3-deoxyphosphooctonate aldolase (KDO 8-P synthase)